MTTTSTMKGRLAPWYDWSERHLDTVDDAQLVDAALMLLNEGIEYDRGIAVPATVALPPREVVAVLADRMEIMAQLLRRRLEQVPR